jgi:hypothetical protein
MHPVAASTRVSVRSRWPALRPPGGGFDLIGTDARTEAITFPEAIERLALDLTNHSAHLAHGGCIVGM